LSSFEALYLSRSSNKLHEAVGAAFANSARSPPGSNDGINIARNVANELDAARFDPLLVRAIAKGTASGLEALFTRMDGMVGLIMTLTVLLYLYSGRSSVIDPR
jgi:hypothetical protein